MTKKIIKIDPKTGDFLVYTEKEWNTLKSIENRANLKNNDLICTNCQRELPNKSFFKKKGCIWCTK